MKYKESTDKTKPHLSFYDIHGQLVPEHIPKETTWLQYKIKFGYVKLLCKLNIPIYYWNMRFLLPALDKKIEDLRFLDHVHVDHADKPLTNRELYHYTRVRKHYGHEYDVLAHEIFANQRQKDATMHPYAKAYIKMWKLERDPHWKMMYHGVNSIDFYDLSIMLIDSIIDDSKKFKRRWNYAKKKLKSKP